MDVLTAEQTRQRLPYAPLAAAIGAVVRSPDATALERTHMSLPNNGTLLLMPAADDATAMTKMVTVHPYNADAGLDTIQGEVVVLDAATGVRKGILDGAAVTGRRTAALSLLAGQALAPVQTGPAVIVGAGVQAQAHIEAFAAGFGTTEFYIQSRTRSRAEDLAQRMRAALDVQVTVVDALSEAPEQVRLYACATTSQTPVLPERLPADAFVAAVGAFKPDMAELPPALLRDSQVIVDTLEGTRAEAGDLIQAAAEGAFDWRDAQTLDAVIDTGVGADGPIVFKSVGHSLWDLAAARLAFD